MTSHPCRDEEFKLLPDLDYEPFTTREEIKSANLAIPPRTNDSMARTTTKTSKPKKNLAQLPPDFVPTSYSVVLGRGKGSYNFVGNKRCRVIVNSLLGEYEKCDSRRKRGEVVSKVLNIIKEACPVGAFIQMKDGRYYSVDEKVAREKIFTMFRDCQTSQGRSMSMSGSMRATRRLSSSSRSTSSAPPRLTMSTDQWQVLDRPDLMTSNLVEAIPRSSHSKAFDDEYIGTIPLTDIFNDDLIDQVNLLDDDEEEDTFLDTLGASFHDVASCDLFSI